MGPIWGPIGRTFSHEDCLRLDPGPHDVSEAADTTDAGCGPAPKIQAEFGSQGEAATERSF